MDKVITFYQNIPLHINPIAFKIGFFQIGWYALSYFIAFLVVYLLLIFRIKKDEESALISNFEFRISKQIPNSKFPEKASGPWGFTGKIQNASLNSFFLYAILGVLIGGRLGYVVFYNLPYYLAHPLEIISPYSFSQHVWTGIYGMSYHGGLLAVILVAVWFCRRYGLSFLSFSDFVVPAIPAGYFFGRLGNFLNGELYGRIAESSWGMYFFDGKNTFLRYPSQLIEAFSEGLIIFVILWIFRNSPFLKGNFLFIYIFLYGLARFWAEFFRQPDEQIGYISGFLTLGQILSLLMIFAGLLLFFSERWYNKTRNI